MPELPEVEALALFLREHGTGRVVAGVEPLAVSVLKTVDPPLADLVGMTIVDARRHGKFLAVVLAGAVPDEGGQPMYLVTHLARAGWLRWKQDQPRTPGRPGRGTVALRVVLDDGSGFDLTEAGTRKRLAVYVVRDLVQVAGIARLGIDPLAGEFTVERLSEMLAGAGRSQLKGVLTDQTLIAGVGNAYSDEALWAARLSPFKPAESLSGTEITRLHGCLTEILAAAVESTRGLTAAELKPEKKLGLAVHGRGGQPCPRCGDVIRDVSFAERSLQYCPTCQTGGRLLADRRLSRLLK